MFMKLKHLFLVLLVFFFCHLDQYQFEPACLKHMWNCELQVISITFYMDFFFEWYHQIHNHIGIVLWSTLHLWYWTFEMWLCEVLTDCTIYDAGNSNSFVAAACSAAGVVVLFERDAYLCRRDPQLPCGRFEVAAAFAFLCWTFSAASALVMSWLLASLWIVILCKVSVMLSLYISSMLSHCTHAHFVCEQTTR